MSIKNRILTSVVVVTLTLAVTPVRIQADVAPPPVPVVGGLSTFEYQQTQVEMAAERVEMEYTPYKTDSSETDTYYKVTVAAWFTMNNTGGADESMQVVFPLSDMSICHGYRGEDSDSYTYLDFSPDTFQAQVNGKIVETKTIKTDCVSADGEEVNSSEQIEWAAFDVTFPAGEKTLIRISYELDMVGGDATFYVGYVLETGAAWKGPIGEAVIVFRFPTVVDQYILPKTTPGYQIMQNEIYWRYEKFEPTHQSNITVEFINPTTWAKIIADRRRIRVNPNDDLAWARLGEDYSDIAHYHGPNIRSMEFHQKAYSTFQDGLKLNPTSTALNADMAAFLFDRCCYYVPGSSADYEQIVPYLQTALNGDPSNEKALGILAFIRDQGFDAAVTVGPTFTPTNTATPTATCTPVPPTATRTPTATPVPKRTATAP